MLGVKRNAVLLEPYDAQWPLCFEETKAELEKLLGDNVICINHIGSTAIRGAIAKPILDVAIMVHDLDSIDTKQMLAHGYHAYGEAGIPGRLFFAKYRDGDISTHHIHCYKPHAQNLMANIAFRDYLNAHPAYVCQYNALKQSLAAAHPHDRKTYTDKKTDFIEMVLRLANFSF